MILLFSIALFVWPGERAMSSTLDHARLRADLERAEGGAPSLRSRPLRYRWRTCVVAYYRRRMLSRKDFEALLVRSEKDLRSKKRRCKATPSEALEQEVALLSQQVAQMRVVDKFYLSFLLSGPSDDLEVLRAHLPRLRSLPLAWLWLIGIDITRVAEGVRLLLTVKGSFEEKPGLLPGVADVLAMRFDTFEATATGASVDEALGCAERLMIDQLKAHPRAAGDLA